MKLPFEKTPEIWLHGLVLLWILQYACIERLEAQAASSRLTVGAILPDHAFHRRYYKTAVLSAVKNLRRDSDFTVTDVYDLVGEVLFMDDYSPPEILDAVCAAILDKQVNTVLYMSNADYLGEHTASGQYLLQVCNTLGIPVIAWNADNSGFFQVSVRSLSPIRRHPATGTSFRRTQNF